MSAHKKNMTVLDPREKCYRAHTICILMARRYL